MWNNFWSVEVFIAFWSFRISIFTQIWRSEKFKIFWGLNQKKTGVPKGSLINLMKICFVLYTNGILYTNGFLYVLLALRNIAQNFWFSAHLFGPDNTLIYLAFDVNDTSDTKSCYIVYNITWFYLLIYFWYQLHKYDCKKLKLSYLSMAEVGGYLSNHGNCLRSNPTDVFWHVKLLYFQD